MRDQPTSNRVAEPKATPRIGSGDWLGCPFCGADQWKYHFAVTNAYCLDHRENCVMGGVTMVYLPAESERIKWNTRNGQPND